MNPRHKHRLLAILLIVTFLGASFGASVGRAAPARASRPDINIAMVSDINTFDPALSSSFYDRQIMNNMYDKLFDLNTKGHIIDDLATGYKVSKNKLVYTIDIRKGVKFTDGSTLNAAAVVFNFTRDLQPNSPRATELALVDHVAQSGPYQVKLTLKAPFSPLISILTDRAGMIVSPKAVQSEGADFAANPVGSGPFMFKERVKGDHITLIRNPHYWKKGLPKAAQVTFKIFTDPNVQLVNLQSGQVDFIDSATSTNIPTILHDKKLLLVDKPGYGWGGFWLNTKDPQLSSKFVRQAISLLIDRKQYVKVVANKTAIASYSPFGPGELAYGAWDKPPARNVKLAKQLLAKAHATDVSFTFETATSPISLQAAQLIQGELQAANITMKIQAEDFPTTLNNLSKHNFQAAAVGWSGRPDPDQNSYNHFISGGPNNYGTYDNATTDKYLNAGRRATDNKKRKADYAKVAKQLQTDVPYVFLDHPNNSFAMSVKLKGFTYVPDGIIRCIDMTK